MVTQEVTPYLITGVTGNLGSAVVRSLLKLVPASAITISSSSASNEASLADQFPGTHFRHANYDDPATLNASFQGVQKLFFVSSNVVQDPQRVIQQHQNVVDAAKAANVKHTYYTSQAFGGYGTAPPTNVLQASHLATEGFLKSSGIAYTALRCSIYSEAFQRIVYWYPQTSTIILPSFLKDTGRITYVSRLELGEAIANILASSVPLDFSGKDNIALLTGPSAPTFTEIVESIAEAASRGGKAKDAIQLSWVDESEWPEKMAEEEMKPGRKGLPNMYFQFFLGIYKGFAAGEISLIDPLMEELLDRKPKDGRKVIAGIVEGLVKEAGKV